MKEKHLLIVELGDAMPFVFDVKIDPDAAMQMRARGVKIFRPEETVPRWVHDCYLTWPYLIGFALWRAVRLW